MSLCKVLPMSVLFRRAVIDYSEPSIRLPENQITLQHAPASVLLLDGHQPNLSLKLIEEARTAGIPTILDGGSWNTNTCQLFDKVDYLIVSEKFAKQYTGEDSPKKNLAILSKTAPFVALTWGPNGVYWSDQGNAYHTPAYDIQAIDSTGAGDAFHGAFALGLALGKDIESNLEYASAVGALTCLKTGARHALPTKNTVSHFMLHSTIE